MSLQVHVLPYIRVQKFAKMWEMCSIFNLRQSFFAIKKLRIENNTEYNFYVLKSLRFKRHREKSEN